jgi:HK97 family phage portal protein
MAVAKIARIFGVPLHLIGETRRVTSWGTGIEQQSIGFITYYMRPKFVVWEQALNRALMSDQMRQRFYFEFNIDGLLRGDFKTRMEGYALLVQWGLTTINEIRR